MSVDTRRIRLQLCALAMLRARLIRPPIAQPIKIAIGEPSFGQRCDWRSRTRGRKTQKKNRHLWQDGHNTVFEILRQNRSNRYTMFAHFEGTLRQPAGKLDPMSITRRPKPSFPDCLVSKLVPCQRCEVEFRAQVPGCAPTRYQSPTSPTANRNRNEVLQPRLVRATEILGGRGRHSCSPAIDERRSYETRLQDQP